MNIRERVIIILGWLGAVALVLIGLTIVLLYLFTGKQLPVTGGMVTIIGGFFLGRVVWVAGRGQQNEDLASKNSSV